MIIFYFWGLIEKIVPEIEKIVPGTNEEVDEVTDEVNLNFSDLNEFEEEDD